jgi:acyl-CoA thioesterase-1
MAAVRSAYGAGAAALKAGAAGLLLLTAAGGASVAEAETTTIAALGDSLTHGYGLAPEDAFPAQLERWLEARGHDVEVINAGVSGDTTRGGLSRLDWTLSDEVDAVIVELGGNDLLRGIDPAESRANLDAILAELDARGLPALIAGLPAPGNYGPDFKREFDAMFPELAEKWGAILYPNFMAALSEREDRAEAMRLMQEDGIHPNAEGVAAIVEAIGPSVERLVERARAGG